MVERTAHRVVIVGGGFGGIGMAIELLRRGIRDLVILEKGAQLGGTWRDNVYPGCACDVPSHLYSFSFAPNPDWSRVFAERAEIQRYLLDTAEAHGLATLTRFGCEVEEARWSDADQRWHLRTSQGPLVADVVIAAAGPLHHARIPSLPGRESFRGEQVHTARWPQGLDLRGRRVAVVGTGSSSIQLVPEIQPLVDRLVLFQRTAAWVLPKPDRTISRAERLALRHIPGLQLAVRGAIYGALELLQLAQRRPAVMRRLQRVALMHLRRQVQDEDLARRLTPDFVLGCKRLLLSNTYYPALTQPNVDVVSRAVERVTERGLVDASGVEHEVDTIVWATGFRVTDPPIAERVVGKAGATLADTWQGSPQAYLGTAVTGFPNLYYSLGPNLGNGHSSAFVIIEAQARYVADALQRMEREDVASFEVRPSVQETYNEQVQSALKDTVWNAGGCASYYIDRNGRNSSIYPWTTIDLRRRLARFDPSPYLARRVDDRAERRIGAGAGPLVVEGAVVAITGAARGIGLATAKAFAERGARVALGDLDFDEAKRAAASIGPRARAYRVDVTSRPSFEAFVDQAEADLGPLDVLVNNAGVMPTGPFVDQPDAMEHAAFAVNVRGTSIGMKLALERMRARGHGHVVNVVSLSGRVPVPGLAVYAASKHAALGLTASVREEMRGTGVSVSAVLPAVVQTRLSDGISLSGLAALQPEDVALGVLRACRTRQAEVVVPRWAAAMAALAQWGPERAMRWVRDAVGGDRAMHAHDTAPRRAYEAEVLRQGLREARDDRSRASGPQDSDARTRTVDPPIPARVASA